MKYWAYVNNEILGPYEKEKLFELPIFSPSTLICPQTPVGEKTEDWKEASTYPEIAALLNSGAGLVPRKAAEAPAPGPKLELEPVVSPKPAPSMERGTPVFNSDEPQIKLKSLSPSRLEQAPLRAADSGGIEIGVKSLGRPADIPQEPARVSGANFDPLTLSQIGRRADQTADAGVKAGAPEPEMFRPAETAAPAFPAEPAPVPAPLPAPVPAPLPAPAPAPFPAPAPAPLPAPSFEAAPAPAAQSSGDARALSEINSRLEALARNAVGRQDLAGQLDPLKDKLSQMGEVLSAIKNGQFQREIMDKLHYLENSLSDIKTSLAQASAPAAAPFRPAMPEPAMPPVFGVQPQKTEPPRPEPETPARGEIVDQGSSAKTSRLSGVFKKVFRALLTIALLIAVLVVAAVFLKNFGVFDATKYVPLPAFLGGAKDAPAPQAFPPQQLEPQAQGTAPAEPQQQPQKPASPEEINYFAQNYTAEKDGKTLQNSIFEDADRRRGNFVKAAWTAKELPGGLFEASVAIPMKKGKGRLVYSYEIDYAGKTLKPRDEQSKKPLDALSAPPLPPKDEPAGVKKDGKGPAKPGTGKPGARPARPAKTQVKAAEPAEDEEYEYEEVEEEEKSGGEE